MAAQEKVPTPFEQELANDLLSIWDRPTSASLASARFSPLLSSTFGDLMSCRGSSTAESQTIQSA